MSAQQSAEHRTKWGHFKPSQWGQFRPSFPRRFASEDWTAFGYTPT